jgi:hypothetical protein
MSAQDTADIAPLSKEFMDVIVGLAKLINVRSLSLPFRDFALWKGLIEVQSGRAQVANNWPFLEMALIATGGPIPGVHDTTCRKDLEWGGEVSVHSGDEVHPADVFAWDNCGGLDPTAAQAAENLSHAVFGTWYKGRNSYCRYFVTRATDIGEIAETARTEVDGWVIYQALNPTYIDAFRLRSRRDGSPEAALMARPTVQAM